MTGWPGEWIGVLDVGTMRLWEDQPPAATLTLAASAAELEALVEALPHDGGAPESLHGELDAEVRSTDGVVSRVTVRRMIVTPGTAPAKLYTGNGEGETIRGADSIRIRGFRGVT